MEKDRPKIGEPVTVTFEAVIIERRRDAVCVVVGAVDGFEGYRIWLPMGAKVAPIDTRD